MKKIYRYHNHKNYQGFTLIELMVSLTLGLLISAAVIQVYMINTKTAALQSGAADLVEESTFNVPTIEKRARLASLGLSNKINDSQPGAGIVLTSASNAIKDKNGKVQLDNLRNSQDTENNGIPKNITINNNPVKVGLLTHTGDQTSSKDANEWSGISNFNLQSGQLTIQYRAPQNMYDCEGRLALGPRRVKKGGVSEAIDGQVIIERFYLRAADPQSPNNLSLYCDAGRYLPEVMDSYEEQSSVVTNAPASVKFIENNAIKDFGGAGQELISNVDYFDILLITKKDKDLQTPKVDDRTIRYYTVNDYMRIDLDKKPIIVGLRYGLILRSNNAVLEDEGATNFNVLGKQLTLKSDLNKKYKRTVVESDITLRNIGY